MKKVLILSDSVALPRETPQTVLFEQTWPHLLRSFFNVHQVSVGGGTISDLARQTTYHKLFDPDIVIIQCGIVDCSPRFMTRFEIDLARRIPWLGKRIIALANNSKVRKFRGITYTPLNRFNQTVLSIKRTFPLANTYAISIINAVSEYEIKLPGVSNNIVQYNEVLKSVFKEKYISLSDFPLHGLMSDYHHINNIGHEYIYDKILKSINN